MQNSTDLRRLQLAELQILKELQRICEAHSLRYYLIGGSAIGAVRHGGFIPWDDDVDVGMPRPDYEKFSALCVNELGEQFFWQTYRTEPQYNGVFGKLRLNNTVYEELPTAHLPIHHGIKIDVFPLDGVPRRERARSLHRIAIKICMMRIGNATRTGRRRSLQVRIARCLPRRLAIALYERLGKWLPYEQCELVINAAGAWGYKKETAPRIWFAEGEKMKFEDIQAPVPKNWDAYLSRIYGDYMQPPPESQREHDRHPTARIEYGAGETG